MGDESVIEYDVDAVDAVDAVDMVLEDEVELYMEAAPYTDEVQQVLEFLVIWRDNVPNREAFRRSPRSSGVAKAQSRCKSQNSS